MAERAKPSAIQGLLKRLNLSRYADKFMERDIVRVLQLRQMAPEVLAEIVPDEADRQTILVSLNSRGALRGDNAEHPHHHDAHNSAMHGGVHQDGGAGGYRGRGRGGFRGNNRGRDGYRDGGYHDRDGGHRDRDDFRDGGNRDAKKPSARPCRLHFSEKGCPYGDKCRYRHDETGTASGFPPSCEPVLEHELALKDCDVYSEEITVPCQRVRFLIGAHGQKLKAINEKYSVRNEQISVQHMAEGTISFKIFGKTAESVQAAKNEICGLVGLLNDDKMKDRFKYVVNELELHSNAARLLCAANTHNKGNEFHLSDSILRNVISTFRFAPRQEVQHFFVSTGPGDKDKLDRLSKLVAHMDGVQAIIFCEAGRVPEMIRGSSRISRSMNHVKPIFVYPSMDKYKRMSALEDFKRGTPNERGVLQRLLVTTGDYAKLARKMEIPFVNFVIHFSHPKSEEFYALQSNVVGRSGTVGASVYCMCPLKSQEHFKELQKSINFTELDSDDSFSETAMQLMYDTVNAPLTSPEAYPPSNWRETCPPPKDGDEN